MGRLRAFASRVTVWGMAATVWLRTRCPWVMGQWIDILSDNAEFYLFSVFCFHCFQCQQECSLCTGGFFSERSLCTGVETCNKKDWSQQEAVVLHGYCYAGWT